MLEENECYSFEADPQKRKQRLMYDLMDKTANRVWCCLESSRICVQKHLPLIYDHERSSSSSSSTISLLKIINSLTLSHSTYSVTPQSDHLSSQSPPPS
mmetsp:Transcript_25479/g.43269  ORF Transcript_25479/g.43269 Transcript_25479/m.43269 type:complete len:99 (+) Transcript_25479:458-754(+)